MEPLTGSLSDTVKVICTDAETQATHAPVEEFSRHGVMPYPECPRRCDVICAALERVPWTDFAQPVRQGDEALGTVHDADYVDFLRSAHSSWTTAGGDGDLVASLFCDAGGRAPTAAAVAIGYYGSDTTPITPGTWRATRAAAAYPLCRPPGHHATRDRFGGYCYLNHAALVAQRLAAHGPVAIVDYHHGNGTQQIFYRHGDVLFVSLHADPEWEYPLFWGRADETGGGDGLGTTLNLPLPTGIDDATYLRHLDTALERVRAFAPRHLVVSAGFDTWKDDPLGTFRLTADGIGAIGAALADLALPTVIVQEGGYALRALGDLAMRFLRPFS